VPRRDGQLRLGPPRAEGLLRIERRKVLSDDLRGSIALDALRADVPADDVPLRIQAEDRVILHAIHEQPKQVLLRRGRRPPVRIVSHSSPRSPRPSPASRELSALRASASNPQEPKRIICSRKVAL